MSNAWKGIVLILFVLLVSWMFTSFHLEPKQQRIHQHIAYRDHSDDQCETDELCSHLPLVVIDTSGQVIPGNVTAQKDQFDQAVTTLADDGYDSIVADVSIIDHEEGNNQPSDKPAISTKSEIRIRGNSSRHFPKKSYALSFIDDSGNNQNFEVMGMAAHHEWALYGPILDKTLIRNYMWYNISGEIMDYAPNVRFCEVVLNGEYQGLYLMTETITNGEGRLNLQINIKTAIGSGYLLRIDRPTEKDLLKLGNIYSYSERMNHILLDIAIRYPKESNLDETLANDIELNYSEFEKALYSYDYDSKRYGYHTWIDTDNFIDYFIINEFTRNSDAGSYSTYIYKEVDEKFKLCVWDFNNACDNYQEAATEPEGFTMIYKAWYYMLLKDEDFADQVIKRYRELRTSVLSEAYLMDYIDETLAYLGPAIKRNNERWADEIENWEAMSDPARNIHSHEEAVEQLKTWLIERGNWLDEHIDAIQAYAHPSRNKAFQH